MRALCVCVLFLAAQPASPLRARQQQAPFKSGVTLVQVDVSVLDKHGKPVAGLTADDFDVKLNGRARPVRVLTYVQVASPSAAAATGATGVDVSAAPATRTATNAAPKGEDRFFVILADDLSFASQHSKAVLRAAQRFVDRLPASDVVGFTTSSGMGIVNPTLDRAPIKAALDGVTGQFNDPRALGRGGFANPDPAVSSADSPIGLSEALDIDSGNMTLLKEIITRECFSGDVSATVAQTVEALIADNRCASDLASQARRTAALTKQTTSRQVQAYLSVLEAMKPATGLKHLVILSDGLGVRRDIAELSVVARAAAAAGVQVSVLIEDPDLSLTDEGRRAVTPPPGGARQTDIGTAQRRREDDRMLLTGVQTMSDMAGGHFQRIIGTPDPFFERVAMAASAVYRLGVEPQGETAPGREFSVSATLRKSGYTVRANRHAVAPGPAIEVPADEKLMAAVTKGQPYYGVPIGLGTSQRRASTPGQVELIVNVEVPASVRGPLTAMFGVLADGSTATRTGRKVVPEPSDGGNYRVTFALPLSPGKYKLRFAVADAAGSVGSVESSTLVQLRSFGPLTASDLITSFVDDKGQAQFIALEELPPGLETLKTSLELYPAAASTTMPDDVHVRMSLTPRGQEKPAAEQNVTPSSGPGLLRADAEFALDQLTPGTYTLRAVVLRGETVLGTVSTTIRKVR